MEPSKTEVSLYRRDYDSYNESMIELTLEQHELLEKNGAHPPRAVDRAAQVEYVLVRAEVYERLAGLLRSDLPDTATLINEVMADDDAGDPYLESYQNYARDVP